MTKKWMRFPDWQCERAYSLGEQNARKGGTVSENPFHPYADHNLYGFWLVGYGNWIIETGGFTDYQLGFACHIHRIDRRWLLADDPTAQYEYDKGVQGAILFESV